MYRGGCLLLVLWLHAWGGVSSDTSAMGRSGFNTWALADKLPAAPTTGGLETGRSDVEQKGVVAAHAVR